MLTYDAIMCVEDVLFRCFVCVCVWHCDDDDRIESIMNM